MDAPKIPFFDLKAMNARSREALISAVTRVVDSGWYILGPEVKAFEERLAGYTGVAHAIGVGNGLDALTLIIRAYKEMGLMKERDEVILASHSYIATVLSITENGLVPVFVEPDPETYNLDIGKIEAAITPRTKAILALHLYGLINYDDTLKDLAEKYDLKIIEDAAQSAGAEWAGRKAGALGDACGMSMYPTKNLGALGDAGVVLTNDGALARIIRTIANYGSTVKYYNEYQGVNSRLDEIHAATLRVKLEILDEDNESRRMLAERFVSGITNPKITLPSTSFGKAHVWHLFVIQVEDRAAFINHLTEKGIDTLVHYPVPPHKQKAYAEWNTRAFPIAEALAERVVSLPLYPTLSEEEVDRIIEACNTF